MCTVAVVGFEMPEYSVNEADGTVEVCLKVFSPSEIDLVILGNLQITDDSAKGNNS